MKLIAHNSCLVFKVQQEAAYARFETPNYDIESKNVNINNPLDTNSDGKVTYSVTLVSGGSAEGTATINQNTGKLTIPNGARGHIKVTAAIADDGIHGALTAEYTVNLYKLYKAGEELDCEKEDYSQAEFQHYNGGFLYTGSNKQGQSVRVYHVPEGIYKADVKLFKIVGYNDYISSSLQIGYMSDVFIKTADLERDRSALIFNLNQDASSGVVSALYNNIATTEGQMMIVRYPSTWKGIELKYLFLQAPENDFPSGKIYVTTVEDIKDYGDYD